VKYGQIALAAFASLAASLALADDFKTVSGKEYKNATVTRVEADGIVIRTKRGIAKVYFIELPKEVQERFNYHFAQGAPVTADREATVEQQNATSSGHGLGETADQFAARYGAPNDSLVSTRISPKSTPMILQRPVRRCSSYHKRPNGSTSEIRSTPRLSLRGRIS
jgi:hypothetical protein